MTTITLKRITATLNRVLTELYELGYDDVQVRDFLIATHESIDNTTK